MGMLALRAPSKLFVSPPIAEQPLSVRNEGNEALHAELVAEFLTASHFIALAASLASAKSVGQTVVLIREPPLYLPKLPTAFVRHQKLRRVAFFSAALTAELRQIYWAIQIAKDSTPLTGKEWRAGCNEPETWRRSAACWQHAAKLARRLLISLADQQLIGCVPEMLHLIEVEDLLRQARDGQMPMLRRDGRAIIPGLNDDRQDRRIPLGLPANLWARKQQWFVALKDISRTGAGLASGPNLDVSEFATLMIGGEREIPATIAWSKNNRLGIQFMAPLPLNDSIFANAWALRRSAGAIAE
jgi:hypothetical protein